MQLALFSTGQTTTLIPPAPPAPKSARKPRRKRELSDMTTDQQIEYATRWFRVIHNFNANPKQSSKGYAEAQANFNAVFALLVGKFSPAQIIAFCMEDLNWGSN